MTRDLLLCAAVVFASACGGANETLTYKERQIEPKSVIYATYPRDAALGSDRPESVVILITDFGGMCDQFNGLACVKQPLIGGALTMNVAHFDEGRYTIGQSARANWTDFKDPRTFEVDATAGIIDVERAETEGRVEGKFDLDLPDGRLEAPYSAGYCRHMRDWLYRCAGGAQ